MQPLFTMGLVMCLSAPLFAQQDGALQHLAEGNAEAAMPLLLLENDGGISGITSIPSFQCETTIAPAVVISNFGNNTLTSAILQYHVDGGSSNFFFWTGSLDPFFSDTVVLPAMTVAPGSHLLTIEVIEANGMMDINGGNNGSIAFNIVGESTLIPYYEPFDLFNLPAGYFIENSDQGPTWTGFDNGEYSPEPFQSLLMPFYYNAAKGDADLLYIQNLDFSNASDATLSFDVAYAYYSEDPQGEYWDALRIKTSTDCGNGWDEIYYKAKGELATAPATDVSFVPEAGDWRHEEVSLAFLGGNANVMIRFEAENGHGNNLYIDNLSVSQHVGVKPEEQLAGVKIYPNPVDEELWVSWPAPVAGTHIAIRNIASATCYSATLTGKHIRIPEVADMPSGMYYLILTDYNSRSLVHKLSILH